MNTKSFLRRSKRATVDHEPPSSLAARISDLTVDYGQGAVLSGLSLDVAEGEVVGLLGPSGCGKTTLLRAIAGFVRPISGSVELAGRRVVGNNAWVDPEHRNVGLVPQEGALFPHLDVGANVAFGLVGMNRSRRAQRVTEVLALVGLAGSERRRPRELSGGQQQRVALARALAPEPSVVLLDEPFSALDATLRSKVRDELRSALHRANATAILVTHDQSEALSFSDRLAVMSGGSIAQVADPATLYRHPVDLDVGEFVGDSVRMQGAIVDGQVQCDLGAAPFSLPPTSPTGIAWKPTEGEPVSILLRPEQVQLASPGLGADRHLATVQEVTFFGHGMLVQLKLRSNGASVLCRTHREELPRIGDSLEVSIAGTIAVFPISGGGRLTDSELPRVSG